MPGGPAPTAAGRATPSRPGRDRPPAPDELAALARLDSDQPLTGADIAALQRLDYGPGPAPDPDDFDPDCTPPDWWLAMSGEEKAWLSDREPPELLDAGFTHRHGSGGIGFAAGGLQARMEACEALAICAGRVWDAGLDRLTDGELAGLIGAARRLTARQAALELAAIGELAARRAGPDGAPGEHVDDEVAALLTLTGWAAARQVALAAALTRLPALAAALAAGRIDTDKADVFASELLAAADDQAAADITDTVLAAAAGLTTSEIRARLRRRIACHDPEAAAKRKQKAQQDAHVDVWLDADGTGALAARGMDPAVAIAADQNLDADARWLRDHGAPGTIDQLRLAACAAHLTHEPLTTLLPQPPANNTAGNNAPGTGAGPAGTAETRAGPAGTAETGAGSASTAETSAGPAGTGEPANPSGVPAPDAPGTAPAQPAPGAGLCGSVNLTIPACTWLGTCDNPGESDRYGTLNAGACRDLAATLAAHPAARWCITLVDRDGQAVGHGCARAGPGPPGSDRAAWLASVTITPIETGTCSHRRESAGYRPSPGLRHIIKIRSPRCGFPGCRRRAVRCDDDHTIARHKGGKTCECNLHPLCRHHHQTKQAEGWHLAQPEPGVLTWTLPSGPTITTGPEPYPV